MSNLPNEEDLYERISDPFYGRATMETETEADGGDRFVISKKKLNAYFKDLTDSVQAYGDTRELEGRGDEIQKMRGTAIDGSRGSIVVPTVGVEMRLAELKALKDKTHE